MLDGVLLGQTREGRFCSSGHGCERLRPTPAGMFAEAAQVKGCSAEASTKGHVV